MHCTLYTCDLLHVDCLCHGLYYRKYAILYDDGNAGRQRADKLWREGTSVSGSASLLINVKCGYYSSYKEWATKDVNEAKELRILANGRKYYHVAVDEKVLVNGKKLVGTIRAAEFGPLGSCYGQASTQGPYPYMYICDACASLQVSKTSTLKCKLLRADKLTNPCSNKLRATKSGVVHKYCSRDDIKSAVEACKASKKKLVASNKIL